MTDDNISLMGIAEIAEFFGMTKQAIHKRSKEPQFPAHIAELRMGRVWTREAIHKYAVEKAMKEADQISKEG